MLSRDLAALLIMGVYTAIVCYIAYWRGYSKGAKEGRAEAEHLYDDLDEATRILGEMAARDRHPSQRLRVVREES